MSTILDALRKVERDRDSPSDVTLDSPAVLPEARRRRSFPMAAVALCAVLGFGGGAVLSWWLPEEAPVEVASLPVPPAPPAIAVPRPPAHTKPVAPTEPETATQKAAPAHPGTVAVPQAAPPAPPLPVVASNGQAPGDKSAVGLAPVPAAAPAVPPIASGAPSGAIATIDQHGSALEPSPFGAPREVPSAPPIAEPAAPKVVARAATPGDVAPEDLSDYDIALAPPAADAQAPTADIAPEPEPEPEAPAETLVDTGRSPVGAPKVALSFLQWSAEPARRFAFISVDGGPSQRVHEGEVVAGVTVAAITPTGIQFKREGTTFVIRPRH